MNQYVTQGGIKIARELHQFIEQEVLPGLELDADQYWANLETLLNEFGPRNNALLAKRDSMQLEIDNYHRASEGKAIVPGDYEQFLRRIHYLEEDVDHFEIETSGVDPEIAITAGPQLVVPIMNARFALNAANARWGSLFDALYGTDLIPEGAGTEKGSAYNPQRGDLVIEKASAMLDEMVPLASASHSEVVQYAVDESGLIATLSSGETDRLRQPEQYVGFKGDRAAPDSLLLKNNGLHIELQVDPNHHVGAAHPASVKDVIMESALTTIQDCEDSVAAVDAEDKTLVYRNWLGLMRGDLKESFEKDGRVLTREMAPDRVYTDHAGQALTLPGRSILLIRNVGHLMTSDAVLWGGGEEAPEGILDGYFTSTIAMYDLLGKTTRKNSRTGSVYIVKPKMHGSQEVAFANELFGAIEARLGLTPLTLKMGIMDEERRTTINLRRCIYQARQRVIFINTGFLDRTGDEIHTSMLAGPVVRKAAMKQQDWINAYEDWNVDQGLASGFKGKAQIGKGMWAMPDEMAQMMTAKVVHPMSGASCAWVPSPTAATLHAVHYHQVSVAEQQSLILGKQRASIDALLKIPLLAGENLSSDEINEELENNAQGILGYVVRWIDQGIGCSKVPDIHDVGLMEDRATLRISSQHIANWLHHGLCSEAEVRGVLEKMAAVVDAQNAGDELYEPMAGNFEQSIAFQAACDLVFRGTEQPNGYTEPVLHARRREAKALKRASDP
ncbi:MAG: malate synthase G [Gammaproteobacteria bacterium]